jgi:hypothetical protein
MVLLVKACDLRTIHGTQFSVHQHLDMMLQQLHRNATYVYYEHVIHFSRHINSPERSYKRYLSLN